MSGFNDGKTAQEVAEIIAADRHLPKSHNVKCPVSETRRKIEQKLEEMKADNDEIEFVSVNYSTVDPRHTSRAQIEAARKNAKKSTFVKFRI